MALRSEIILKKYKWTQTNDVCSTGFTFFKNEYVEGDKFQKIIAGNTNSFEDFRKFAEYLNGQFSIIVKKETEVWLFCGHTWSFPVFYSTAEDWISVSDEPDSLSIRSGPHAIDSQAASYFLLFGVTPAQNTLKKGISQVQPGDMIRLTEYQTKSFSILPFEQLAPQQTARRSEPEELFKLLTETFDRYYHLVRNKKVLLPLTKGYDSRLLACLLKEFGHPNVICATWGREQNPERATAEKVAKRLGYDHEFIGYTDKLIEGLTREEEFHSYINFAGHQSSMPYFQDYFAVKELLKKNIIDQDTFAMPGHPGDFLRGAHLDRKMVESGTFYFLSKITALFGSSYPLSQNEMKQVKKTIETDFFRKSHQSHWKSFEKWDFQERQCKFIGNSTQVFPFFGVNYIMPLFDMGMLRFFATLPLEQKIGEKLYNETLETKLFKKYKVDFALKSRSPNGQILNRSKKRILKYIPRQIKNWYYPLNDSVFYREITREIKASEPTFTYKHPIQPHRYNSYIIQWYLQFVQKNS